MNFIVSHLLIWHCMPVNPEAQLHEKLFKASVHVAPYKHGILRQLFISINLCVGKIK